MEKKHLVIFDLDGTLADTSKGIYECYKFALKSLGRKEPTYESIRKMIIMLFSYTFWYHVQWKQKTFDIEDYTEQLNALLNESGFSPLYYGNPYDWMFLYCTLSDAPLDVFRGMVSEVLNEEE